MSATKPADLTLTLQKVTEGFTAIVDCPMDTDFSDIRLLLLNVLMKMKHDEMTLKHNLLGVILPTERYEHIYSNGAYLILSVIALYNETIDKEATRTEFHRAEGKHESNRKDRALYETADTSCKKFIMEFVDKVWYKELEDPDTFYTNVTSLKLLNHLTKFCSGLHTVNAVDISQVMKTLFRYSEGIQKFINVMEAAHQKTKQVKLVIHDE